MSKIHSVSCIVCVALVGDQTYWVSRVLSMTKFGGASNIHEFCAVVGVPYSIWKRKHMRGDPFCQAMGLGTVPHIRLFGQRPSQCAHLCWASQDVVQGSCAPCWAGKGWLAGGRPEERRRRTKKKKKKRKMVMMMTQCAVTAGREWPAKVTEFAAWVLAWASSARIFLSVLHCFHALTLSFQRGLVCKTL